MRRSTLGVVLLAGCVQQAVAATNDTAPQGSGDAALNNNALSERRLDGKALQELYGGIVTDQTITVAGQTFYQLFVAGWRDMPLHERYVLSVRERPSARWGNEVWVEYAQQRVFNAVLPPNRSNIKIIAEQAVDIAYKNVGATETQRLLFRDPDLGSDEL